MDLTILPTQKDELKFVLNPSNGKWIYTNNLKKFQDKLLGNINLRPLTGTQMVLLNVGRNCNLSCKYCFLGSKKDDKREMPLDIAFKSLQRVSEMRESPKNVVFHGSEPLMNFKLIKAIVKYGKEIDKDICYSMQTNGTLLNSETISFIKDNNIYTGISLDGTKESHNYTRPFKNGSGSFDIIVNNLHQLKKYQGKVSFITVITKHNVNSLDKIVDFGKKVGADDISLNPVYSIDPDLIPDEQELSDNLIQITETYFSDLLNGINTPKLDHPKRYLSMLLHSDKYTNSCVQCSAGPLNPLIGIDIDGMIYPCDHFWEEKEFAIGHIDDISFDEASKSTLNFRNNINFNVVEECINCDWRHICSGGCPGGRIINKKGQYCNATRTLFTYFAGRIPVLKENGLLKIIFDKSR